MTINDIRNLIRKGDLDKAIDAMFMVADKLRDNDLSDNVTLQSSRYHKNEKDNNNGVVGSDFYNRTRAQVTSALQSYLNDISDVNVTIDMEPDPPRTEEEPTSTAPAPPSPQVKAKILFLSASPESDTRKRVDIEYREIKRELQGGDYRDLFDLETETAIQLRTLSSALMKQKPQIVHFSGHGKSGGLEVEGETQHESYVIPDVKLQNLFKIFKEKYQMTCVVLSSCYSEAQAEAISKLGLYVAGMNSTVEDRAAIEFSIGFYQALGEGLPIAEAFELGKFQMTTGSELPVLWYGGTQVL